MRVDPRRLLAAALTLGCARRPAPVPRRAPLVFVPTAAGAYVLRVTTHGSWLRTGGYVLEVE